MKNFKLLLATTAILSMGTMAVNAGVVGQDTLTVPVSAEVIRPLQLEYTQELDFGRVIAPEDRVVGLTMDSTGNVTVSGPNASGIYMLEQGKAAIITGASCNQIELPSTGSENLLLTNPEGAPEGNKAYIGTLSCVTVNEDTVIYGTLYFQNMTKAEGETYGTVYPGVYHGSFTITAIYHDDLRTDD